MTLPELVKAQVINKFDEYCSEVPERVKHQLKFSYKIRGSIVTLYEERLTFRGIWVEIPIARFKYEDGKWSLGWPDSKDKWHNYYKEIANKRNPGTLDALVDEVEQDAMGIFWG